MFPVMAAISIASAGLQIGLSLYNQFVITSMYLVYILMFEKYYQPPSYNKAKLIFTL